MSKNEQEPPCGEIVIVRRKKGGEDCHHGGVWKVAYADFMTAMMAFFLVMWLINAANEATRAQVASYFNPVKLVDTTTNPRGLQENKTSSSGDVENKELKSEAVARTGENDTEANADDNKQKRQQRKRGPATYFSGGDIPESELFRDPVRTLDKIAGGAPDLLKGSAHPQSRQRTLGAAGGEQFRDPYSPRSWESLEKTLPEEQEMTEQATNATRGNQEGDDESARRMASLPRAAQKPQAQHRKQALARKHPGQQRQQHGRGQQKAEQAQADSTVKELRKAIAQALAAGDAAHLPAVNVRRTSEGVLISLADHDGFGMFDVGSARPRPQTVRFLARIARILRKRKDAIIVRGHTDARPFRSRHYDNWRLSTARAHMARYMLLRGGVPSRRFLRVEGYADSKPAVPDDPLDARNRRIEILLKEKRS